MIDPKPQTPDHKAVCAAGLNRSTYYYEPIPTSELALMRAIDELYLERPTRESRSMRDALEDEGFSAGRHRIRRLMRNEPCGHLSQEAHL